jgi:transposase
VIGFAVAQSLEAVQQQRWRQAPFGSRPQTIVVTTGRRARLAGSGCGGDHLLAIRRLDRSERLVAELAEDVVGASAKLARDG